MGNRIIGGGFGPYLSTVNLGGNPEKNAVLMDRNLTNTPVISWNPPKTLRFGEPVDGTYLSARSNIRLNFQYRLDGELINDGDQPIFDPGELDFSVLTIGENEQNETRVIKGLKEYHTSSGI